MAKVRKAVITAAGRGTRQYPASTAVQKEMFPLVDRDGLTKPVIQIIGEEAIDSGIEEICIITQPGEEQQYRDQFKCRHAEEAVVQMLIDAAEADRDGLYHQADLLVSSAALDSRTASAAELHAVTAYALWIELAIVHCARK